MSTIEPVESVEDQRDADTEGSKKKGFLQNNKLMMTLATILGVVLIVLALSLAIVFSTGSKEYPAREYNFENRIDCVPWMKGRTDVDIRAECAKLPNCVYQKDETNPLVPSCFFNIDEAPSVIRVNSANETELGLRYEIVYRTVGNQTLPKAAPIRRLTLEFEFLDDFALRFKISDPSEKEYEVPIKINKPATRARNPRYEVKVYSTYFAIIRKSNQRVIWNNSLGPLIYDKFQKQITTVLPSKNVYGFGENRHESFRHNLNYQNWPMFARDEPPELVPYANLYGSQPFYTCMEEGGQSHGVVLVNSNAIDYEFTPYPALTYRVTGGVLDFYVFLGPEPENVIQQFTKYFGRTFFPPYWALGFQVSRYGYKDLDDMKKVLARFEANDIPLDTQVADIDHYDKRKDFTIDPINWAGLPQYFDELHAKNMKTVMILDPALVVNEKDYWPFDEGKKNDVFIKWPKGMSPDFADTNSDIMLGWCWPEGKVAYPDYFKNSTQKWWIDSILRHHKTLSFDGLWIDMNEPAVFGTNDKRPFNMPDNIPDWSLKCPDSPYEVIKTKSSYLYDTDKKVNKLSDKTLCMTGLQGEKGEYLHYDVHNLYGLTESIPTYEAAKRIVNGKRPFVITRSTFLGSGQYGGHWTGDNHSRWSHLYYSIIGMLEFNLFGIPYVGADICGFWEDATDELCARWSSLGAFYPFSRNHNNEKNKEQDPGAMSAEVISSAKKSLNIRYEILPYYYTLFYRAHVHGNTVIRPLFHEYPSDPQTYGIDKQFLVGPAFLVTPVIEEKKTSVEGYFPADKWYSYYNGRHQENTGESGAIRTVLDAPIDFIPLHIRGGYIIPTQEPARTTELSSKNPFGIIVAPNEQGEAKGDLFYDDGSTELNENAYFYATFSLAENEIQMNIEHNTYGDMSQKTLNNVRLFVKGVRSNMRFYLNGVEVDKSQIEFKDHEVVLSLLNHDMSQPFKLVWSTDDLRRTNTLVDCSLQNTELNEADCKARGCEYDGMIASPAPKCYVPSGKGGYKLFGVDTGSVYELQKADDFSLFQKDVKTIIAEVTDGTVGNSGTHKATRIKITDKSKSRYEVPIDLNYKKLTNPTENNLDVQISGNDRAFMEVKTKDGSVLFDTKNIENAFVYDDQFIQIYFNLRDYKNAYGFGENTHHTFRHQFAYDNWWAVFGRDQPTGGKRVNHYGAHPFFMAVNEKNGRAFGMLIMNSNAQEYGFLPQATLAYRTMGGILDLYIIEAESPEAVIETYTQLIGTPFFPPYWSLGFQLCRYGYKSLSNLKAAVDRTLKAQIPLDIQYADIDHYDKRLDFTYDPVAFKGMPQYIDELRSQGIKFIIILDPAIDSEAKNYAPYENGKKADVYIKWPKDNNPQLDESPTKDNQIMLGYVWPDGKTAFPDYFKNSTKKWWISEIVKHYKTLKFDGLWIDMNEPANFDTNKEKPWNWPAGREPWNLHCPTTGPGSELEDPAYRPLIARLHDSGDFKARMSDKTICMIGLQGQNDEYKHYDVHNLYGHVQSFPTLDALREIHPGKRSIVISRSTFISSGTAVGHWLGDNTSQWKQLKLNLIGLLEFNLFGIPYVGADTCGFFDNATPEMCTRWMQVGAFNTFFRNHNGFDGIDQDPAALGVDTAAASKKVVETRYTLLPYLYSLFYHVHTNGGTVVRSLVHEFPSDPRTLEIYQQFMWGSHLLISPVLDRNTREVYAYFPKARWYDYYSGQEVKETGRVQILDAPLDHLPLHVRGGAIIVTQGSAMNTEKSRLNPFSLLIAMRNEQDEFKTKFYYDDGNTLDISGKSTIVDIKFNSAAGLTSITLDPIKSNYKTANLTSISIYGWNKVVKTWTLDGKAKSLNDLSYDHANKVLEVHKLEVDFRKKAEIKITY